MEMAMQLRVNESITPGITEASVKSYTLSKHYVRVILKLSLFNILYHRLPISKKEVLKKYYHDVPYFVHKSADRHGVGDHWFQTYCCWLPAINDSIQNNYLKTMYVYLFTPEGVIIETYRFDLKYNKDSNFSYKTEDKKTPEEVFTATIFFLKGVNKLGTLDKLDETTKLDIEMLLTNDCPDDYRPPYFHKSDNPIHNTIQNYTLLGQITTGFHKLSSRCSGLKLPLESIKKVSKTTLDLNENTFDMDIESVQNSQVIYTQEQYDTAYSTVNYGQYRKDYEVLNILDDSEEEEQQQQEAEDVVKACPKKRFDNSNITVSDRVETSIESNIGISCICKLEAPGFISIIRCAQCEQPFHAPCYDCFTDNPNFVFTCLDCRSADKNIPVSLVKETSLKAKMRIILLCLMKIGAIPKGILNSINPEDEQWIIQKMISSNLCEPETKSLSNCLVLWPKVDTFLEVLTNDKRISIQNLFH